jgi:two-component system LytT family response regulator
LKRYSYIIIDDDAESILRTKTIAEGFSYLTVIPKIIVNTTKKELAFEAIQYGVFDYLLKPLMAIDLLKTVLKIEKGILEPVTKENRNEVVSVIVPQTKPVHKPEKPLIICIKSYGDYRYLNAADIAYFQADNNSTDIYLNSGEMITAFKTLKHFESILDFPFIRIHNSYIINQNYIARIHNGNSVCYIKNSPKKIPFSKTYKSNVDIIIANFAAGNYIEV